MCIKVKENVVVCTYDDSNFNLMFLDAKKNKQVFNWKCHEPKKKKKERNH